MTRRVLSFVLALAIASGTQGSLMYAAAAPAGAETATGAAAHGLVATATTLPTLSRTDVLADALTDSAIQCLRGGHQCFGVGSENCCAEMVTLGAIAGAVGAWLAAGVATYYYWHYC